MCKKGFISSFSNFAFFIKGISKGEEENIKDVILRICYNCKYFVTSFILVIIFCFKDFFWKNAKEKFNRKCICGNKYDCGKFFPHTMMFILEFLCIELCDITFLLGIFRLVIFHNFVVGLKDRGNIVRITDLVFQNLKNEK